MVFRETKKQKILAWIMAKEEKAREEQAQEEEEVYENYPLWCSDLRGKVCQPWDAYCNDTTIFTIDMAAKYQHKDKILLRRIRSWVEKK